ncbi:MAG: hypothetical protein B6244_02960 [Candidatus Cloacimonetes bacterium 4572_55]|nr:MAG: hypothetical protein B6244_02960 [Candidatus Cloacimonetes bacterium 4572_55]
MKSITVEAIPSKPSYLKKFINFAWTIYKDDPAWIPPLIVAQLDRLSPKKDPYHLHSETQLFWAKRDGKIVGRISASIDRVHNETHNEKAGFFGFFECVNDIDVSTALLDTAANWLRDRGMEIMRGPGNFSTNHEWSLLIKGFEHPPYIMMTHNPPYYADLIEHYGFAKAKDLHAYSFSAEKDGNLNSRVIRIAERMMKRHNITLRSIDSKQLSRDIGIVKELYRLAWEDNWGFVPLTDAEIVHLAKELKPILVPELGLFAEVDGEPVGFSLTLPNVNQALKKINGRLLPFGWLKLMHHIRHIDCGRLLLLGVKPGFRKRGIEAMFYKETFRRARAIGYRGGEISWTLEDNVLVNRAIEDMGGKLYKIYRAYARPL